MRAIVRDTYGSPDVRELPHQALGFRVQAYGVTPQKHLFTRRQLVARTPCACLIDEVGYRMIGDGSAWEKRQESSHHLAEAMQSGIKDSHMRTFPGGHVCFLLRQKQCIEAIVDFLDSS
jgi:hypothetical protein